MSAYRDVYGILDLLAMRYQDKQEEEETILEFSLWPFPKNKPKPVSHNPILIEPELFDSYPIEDPYDFINENIFRFYIPMYNSCGVHFFRRV